MNAAVFGGGFAATFLVRLSGDYDGSARTAQLGKITVGGHSDGQDPSFSANDRTIEIGLL